MELIAPAGNLAALKAAVLAGADAVYLGLKNATNARNFAGLNFTEADIAQGVAFARQHGRQVLFAINTFAQPGRAQEWRAAVDAACRLGADALILADPGVLEKYAVALIGAMFGASATLAAVRSVSTSRTAPATCRCNCTTAARISRSGAATNT